MPSSSREDVVTLFLTVGQGLRNNTGRLLTIKRLEQVLGGNDPIQREMWFSGHEWKDNKRSSANWIRSCLVTVDLDFRDASGEKMLSDPYADVLRKAFDERIFPASHAYLSPHGLRAIFLLDVPTDQKDLYRDAVDGAHHVVASVVEQLCPGVTIDQDTSAMKDLARINWFLRTIDEKGVKRLAQLWTQDGEDGEALRFTLAQLLAWVPAKAVKAPMAVTAPPATVVDEGARSILGKLAGMRDTEPTPTTPEGLATLEAAREAYNRDHADLSKILKGRDPLSRRCPFCDHDGCFGPLMLGTETVPGAWICRSTKHEQDSIRRKKPVGVRSRDGASHKFDSLDIHAHLVGLPKPVLLTNLGYYKPHVEAPMTEDDGRPQVHLPNAGGTQFYVSDTTFTATVMAHIPDGELYRYAGGVVRLERDDGMLRQWPVTSTFLGLLAGRFVQFLEYKVSRDGLSAKQVLSNPSKGAVELLMAYATSEADLRELRGVVRFPAVVKDFDIVQPGWNERSGFYYDEPDCMKGLQPARMTPAQRRAWLEEFLVDSLDVLSAENLANAVGLMVTALVRPALVNQPVPLHAAISSIEGSGKTFLCDVIVGYGVTGRNACNMVVSHDSAENAKALFAYAASGATCINLDNIKGGTTVDDAQLASALTRATITARVLGTSTMREEVNLFVPMMTGNNISFSPEMTRRTVPIRFQPQETIHDRRFRHEGLSHVEANRRRLLEVLLGAIEDWKNAGQPAHSSGREFSGFRRWSHVVGGIVEQLGFSEWLQGVREWQQSDESNPVAAAMRSLVAAWHADPTLCSKPCSVIDLWPLIEDNPGALGITAPTPHGQRVQFGTMLRQMEGRPDLKPFRIVRHGKSRKGAQEYMIERDYEPPLPMREPGEEG